MILIVDFGSQTAHLIGRRIRDFGVKVMIVNPENAYVDAKRLHPDGIILSGGPSSVYQKGAPTVNKKLFELGIPILGICYGQQLMAYLLPGGKTERGAIREDGPATLVIDQTTDLFKNISSHSRIWMSHGDAVTKIPTGFTVAAHSQTTTIVSMFDAKRKLYGVQFHPEVEHTEHGNLILHNFIGRICKLKTKKRVLDVDSIIVSLREKLHDKNVIAAVSGGVDSTVASVLVAKAIGKRLTVIYCDNGLMRLGTKEEVCDIFKNKMKVKLRIINCEKLFLERLKGIIDPEEKRKIIGRLYIEIFEKEALKIKNVGYLVQGTIYSDVIESKGTKHAAKIKSHHNVGGLPMKMKLTLVEPLREFYKDEVRVIGKKLGLPDSVIWKQPLPGPGHAIRIIGEVTKERLIRQQQADKIVMDEIINAGLYKKVFQSFSILTGINSTAVKGDGRFYGEVIALRIYDSSDIMSASWSRIDYDILQKIVNRITNEVPGVSRVVYDITTKPPATMEWE